MEQRRFSSPREEALEIAIQTRKGILEGKGDAESVSRAYLVIANILNKTDPKKWLISELNGYKGDDKIPWYRNISCPLEDDLGIQFDLYRPKIYYSIHELSSILQSKKPQFRIKLKGESRFALIEDYAIRCILNNVVDVCLIFLNDTIIELQYGGIVEYLMEEIRKNTDEKFTKLDSKLTDEAQSLYLNLSSTNPADWNKVGHSCRKILQLLADIVFPPKEESYKMKDDRDFEVGKPHFINRLCAFLDQKTSGDERKFVIAEIKFLESYLRQIVEYDQMGEHKPSIEKYHANMMAIHTYLIISEIMRHIQSP